MCFCMSTIGMDTYPLIYPVKNYSFIFTWLKSPQAGDSSLKSSAENLLKLEDPAEKWHEFSRMHREKWHVETVFVILRI